MTRRIVLLSFVLAATFALRAAAGSDSASGSPSPASGVTAPLPVLLRLIGSGERPDGGPSALVSASVELSASGFREVALHTDAEGCMAVPRAAQEQSNASAGLAWTVAARLVAATGDSVTVHLRWARRRSVPGAETVTSFEESRRVVLREGAPYPLDMVRAPDAAGGTCDRVVIQLGFEVIEPGEVADAALRYDLWLVHHDPSHGETTDRVQASGRQGLPATYIFAPVHHSSSGGVVPTARPDGIETEVSGTLRGRARADGSIAISVQTWRTVTPRGRSAGLGNGGMKELTVRPGETIEVALPPVSGRIRGQDMATLFEGQGTSIRITTTRLR